MKSQKEKLGDLKDQKTKQKEKPKPLSPREKRKRLAKQRLKICSKCSELTFTKAINSHTCGKFLFPKTGISCGCILKLKTPLKKQSCPQSKW